MPRTELGKYIVADPEICHGTPTFKGTRIMVWLILEEVAEGKAWDAIVANWRGEITLEGIGEAVQLAQPDSISRKSRKQGSQFADVGVIHGENDDCRAADGGFSNHPVSV